VDIFSERASRRVGRERERISFGLALTKTTLMLGVEREMLCIHEHKKNNKKAGVKGGWAIAQSPILNTTITLKRLKQRGYQSLTDVYIELNPSLCEPPST